MKSTKMTTDAHKYMKKALNSTHELQNMNWLSQFDLHVQIKQMPKKVFELTIQPKQ